MTADPLGPYSPTIHRFTLGAAEITTIHDGAHLRDAINPPFSMEKSEAEIARIAAANNLPSTGFENSYSLTLVSIGGQLVLFDVGLGEMGRKDGAAGHLRRRMAHAGYSPQDVDVVAFTHCHPDHIAGVMEGGDPAFPNARYVIGRREYDAWCDGSEIPAQRAKNRETFLRLLPPLAHNMTFIEDGDTVVPGITAAAAFGHSIGHMMYRVESGAHSLLIWGDVTNHYVFSLQYPDSLVGFDDDKEAAIATRKTVLDMVATDRLLVSGYHMPFPSIGYVERHAQSYRWTPVTYQLKF